RNNKRRSSGYALSPKERCKTTINLVPENEVLNVLEGDDAVVLVYGAGAANPAADYEGADHGDRAQNPHGAAAHGE
ncbi:hypothetical protein MJN54_28345, partial [Salmonella enterica subsp. enterica serovar Kentucky]|nr:hypothetical protein [Salmonella enterica subsp. enterica serovar Kentucky]